jgi:hypothetical protein
LISAGAGRLFFELEAAMQFRHYLESDMQLLVDEISTCLETEPHFAIYEPDLDRVWPKNGINREAEIRKFAAEHGWELRYYKDGFCAIFAKVGAKRHSAQ